MTSATETTTDRLLTARQAADYLAVSERTLWSITAPRGPLACVRIVRSVRYDPADLRAYVAGQRRLSEGSA